MQQISRYTVIDYGFKSHQPHQIAKKPCFMGFFVVIRAIFDNFLCINITFNIKLLPYISAICYKLRTDCAQNCAQNENLHPFYAQKRGGHLPPPIMFSKNPSIVSSTASRSLLNVCW